MKIKSSALVLLVVLGLALVGMSSPPKAIASPTAFTTLTINLLFSEIQERPERLVAIADFVKDQTTLGEPIDAIFLQEVVSGSLVGTKSSAQDLNKALADRGLTYYPSSRIEEGLPGIFTEGIAILSRHKIVFSLSHTLPFVEIVNFNGLKIPLRRIVLMNRIDIADYGKTDIYNTHLCSECDASGRTQQVKSLLNFISTVEKSIPGKNPVILGGDFNINLFNSTERPGYKLILKSGFIDTYDAINHVGFTCCTPTSGGSCCTFGVPGNPYAIDFLTHLPEFPQRLDYIFTKGISATNIINSTVVFNTDSFVSDHSGVLTKVLLP